MTTGRINQVAHRKREPAHRLGEPTVKEAPRDNADRQSRIIIRVGEDMPIHINSVADVSST